MDKYEKVRIVGRGAYGTVYLSRRLADGKEVILKQIPVEQMSVLDRQATLTEIRVLAMLHHPNIIEYYESFLQDKAMMIAMEFAAGGTLYDMLEARAQEGRGLEEEEVAHLFAQIVLPIFYVHKNQILHRDLKSENIFLTRALDHIKIGDFGISKILSSKSKALTVVGTPCYISPELCEGKPYNQKSDIWALGCILYELCTCKRAFEAPTLPALIIKIIRGITAPLPAQYSPGLRHLLSSLLATDPGKRPTVEEVMAHHWLAPHILRIHVSVGSIPCTAKPPRPLSVTRPEELDQPDSLPSKFAVRRRSPSPFLMKEAGSVVFQWGGGDAHPTPLKVLDPRADLTEVKIWREHLVGVDTSGQVTTWDEGRPKILDGLSGINIVNLAVGDGFLCLLTDRGILLTKGSGKHGCLGHGNTQDVTVPKIVEALLGDEVTQVSAGEKHVAALTSDGELFTWGVGEGGCLGLGEDQEFGEEGRIHPLPQLVNLDNIEEDPSQVLCGDGCSSIVTTKNRLFVTGSNQLNRLGLDKGGVAVEGCGRLTRSWEGAGPVKTVALGRTHMLLLTVAGEVWSVGRNKEGELGRKCGNREVGKVELGEKVAMVGVGEMFSMAATEEGKVLSWGKQSEGRLGREGGARVGKINLDMRDYKNKVPHVKSIVCSHSKALVMYALT